MNLTLFVTRTFPFCAGHRLLGHQGKCRWLHGHNYVASVTLEGSLNPLGVVVDFADMKAKIGGWIDAQWDHNMILHQDDSLLLAADYDHDLFAGREPFITTMNPTAENLTVILAHVVDSICRESWPGVRVAGVSVIETDSCSANARVV